jgi:hypothetical protein
MAAPASVTDEQLAAVRAHYPGARALPLPGAPEDPVTFRMQDIDVSLQQFDIPKKFYAKKGATAGNTAYAQPKNAPIIQIDGLQVGSMYDSGSYARNEARKATGEQNARVDLTDEQMNALHAGGRSALMLIPTLDASDEFAQSYLAFGREWYTAAKNAYLQMVQTLFPPTNPVRSSLMPPDGVPIEIFERMTGPMTYGRYNTNNSDPFAMRESKNKDGERVTRLQVKTNINFPRTGEPLGLKDAAVFEMHPFTREDGTTVYRRRPGSPASLRFGRRVRAFVTFDSVWMNAKGEFGCVPHVTEIYVYIGGSNSRTRAAPRRMIAGEEFVDDDAPAAAAPATESKRDDDAPPVVNSRRALEPGEQLHDTATKRARGNAGGDDDDDDDGEDVDARNQRVRDDQPSAADSFI